MDPNWSALDDIAPDLRKYLNIGNLRPILRAQHLLTDDEFEQVEISPANPTSQAIEKFVSILKTKSPDHAEMLLDVLETSLQEDDYHLGHKYLSSKLQAAISERKRAEKLTSKRVGSQEELALRQAISIPAHLPARPNDSGLGLVCVPDSGCSQDTGSPRSTFSGASIASYPDGFSQPKHRLRIPGLKNLEDGSALCKALDEQQISRLKHKIIHDTNNITSTFAVTVLRVYQLLKQNHTPVDEVRIMLQFLGCRTSNKTGSDSITMFSGSDEMSESKDMAQLFECLRKYSSWYNYRLMKEVAEQFAGDEGKRLIADYEANLLRYYVSLVAYQCPDFVLEQKVPPGYTQVIVKVDWDFMSTNLQDISTFQANLADILELEPYVFQLRSVDEGCVRLEWAIPDALEPYVAEMMAEKEECLRKLRVLRMEVVSASSPLAGEKIFIGQPPSRKAKGSRLGCKLHPSCSPSLSGSSSIVSILDQPMSSIEAELLSLYSSGSSRGGSMHDESTLPPFNYAKCVPCEEYIGESDGWEGSGWQVGEVWGADATSDMDVEYTDYEDKTKARNYSFYDVGQTPTSAITHFCTPVRCMRRVFHSEGNLPLSHSNLEKTKKEGLSMPHIAEGSTSAPRNGTKKPSPSKIMHSLTKLRRRFLDHLRHSDKKMKRVENEGTMYCTSPSLQPLPFLLDFTEEPRKIGSRRDINRFSGLQLKVDNLPLSQLNMDDKSMNSVKHIEVPPFLDVRRDSAVSAGSFSSVTSPSGLQLPAVGHRRDSAVPSSPSSSISFREGEDTASLASVSTQPSLKINSHSSHYYVNINPIMEDPDDPHAAEMENHWEPRDPVSFTKYPPNSTQASSETYSLEKCDSRERSHSLNDGYIRSVRPRLQSSPQSSGYVSYAGSTYHVDSDTMHSKESLTDGACGLSSPSPHLPRCHAPNSTPFPSATTYPGNANVRRGGSLKASVKFVTKPPLLQQRSSSHGSPAYD